MKIPYNAKLAIVGDNDFATQIIKKLLEDQFYNITCILTNKKNQKSIFDLPIYQFEKAKELFNKLFDTILILDDMPYQSEFYFDLYSNGFENVYIMVKESTKLFNEKEIAEESLQCYNLQEKPILKYIEMHITDQCNLRCKGCTHFSSLFMENETSYENFCKDVDELSKRFNIPIIRLMGGEALLTKDLDKYLDFIRRKFKESKIFVVSNGLLVPYMSEKVVTSFIKNNIVLNMTVYKPTYEKIQYIEDFLIRKNIIHFYGQGHKNYSANDVIENFHTCLTTSNNRDIKNSGYSKCYGKYCWMIRNGLIAKCCYPLLIYKLNEKYKTNFKVEALDCHKLSEVNDLWGLIKNLSSAIPFCKYCSNEPFIFKWSGFVAKPTIKDFIKEE